MWIWIVAIVVTVVTYIYYILSSSSGSSFESNSIDAFIRPGLKLSYIRHYIMYMFVEINEMIKCLSFFIMPLIERQKIH